MDSGRGMSRFSNDLRFGWRQLRKSPAFAFVAVASLALGIGANTAIFSLVDALLLKGAPGVARPETVVELGRSENGSGSDTLSYPDLLDLRRGLTSLSHLFGYAAAPLNTRATSESDTRRAFGLVVTANYFDALGVVPVLGRGFRDDEDSAAAAPVAVVSHEYWEKDLAGAPNALGTALWVNGKPVTVVGVLPREFHSHWGVLAPDVFLPFGQLALATPRRAGRELERNSFWVLAGGRLRPGTTLAAARAELAAFEPTIVAQHPSRKDSMGLVLSGSGTLTADLRRPLAAFALVLFGLVGTLLLLAAFNVAGLLLARGERRRSEIALRRALGADRRAIVRQLLVEAALLLTVAAVAAVPLARLAVAALLSIQPATPIPVILDVPLDARVLAFTVAVAALSVLLFALAPALKVSAQDPAAALRPSAGAVRSRTRLRNGLVIAQVAGSTLLLGVSAMLIGALGRAGSIPLGFDPRAVFAFDTDLSLAGYTGEAADLFADRLLERVGELPQLESVALGAMLPLDMESMGFGPITVPGAKTASGEPASFDASVNVVSPAWFATLRIPVRGRVFDAGDRAGAERVAILNRTAARRFFGLGLAGGDEGQAIGRSFEIEADAGGFESYRVVGVSDDGKYKWLGEGTEAHVYFSLPQHRRGELHLVARARSGATDGAAATLAAREVRALDPNVALAGPRWLEAIAQTSSLPQRIGASVASGMGTLGLALAAIGLYGALALRVGERRREIGVRLALGAAPRQVGRWVAREGVRLTLVGLAVGTALTVAVGFLMRGLLYGSSPLSPATLAAAPLILATIALLAAIGPIRQAVRVDPSTTLRSE